MGKFFTWLPHIDKIIHFIEDQSGKILCPNLSVHISEFQVPYTAFLKIHICIIRLPE